jgi:hypothetical protein
LRQSEKIGGATDECLVSVRPDVLHDAEHAVGNLLQRVHHMVRVATAGVETQDGERLRGVLADLERLLEHLFDYVLPVDGVSLRATEVGRVVDSLAAQVRAHAAADVSVSECPAVWVLVDAKTLSRSFHLLGTACGKIWQSAATVAVAVRVAEDRERVQERIQLSVELGDFEVQPASAECRMAAAVAARLIELQGGELSWSESGQCSLILPVQGGGHENI